MLQRGGQILPGPQNNLCHHATDHNRIFLVAVGAPIPVDKKTNPSVEDIDRVHKMYIERLQILFDTYKKEYAPDHPNATLTIQ